MKITIKLNIGNYETIDFETNENDNIDDCYKDTLDFLADWEELGGKRQFDKIRSLLGIEVSEEARQIMDELKQEDAVEDTLTVVQEVSTPIKRPNAPKIEMGKIYKLAGKPCKTCGGFISWDDYSESNKYPVHVSKDGKIIGDGTCPEYGG